MAKKVLFMTGQVSWEMIMGNGPKTADNIIKIWVDVAVA